MWSGLMEPKGRVGRIAVLSGVTGVDGDDGGVQGRRKGRTKGEKRPPTNRSLISTPAITPLAIHYYSAWPPSPPHPSPTTSPHDNFPTNYPTVSTSPIKPPSPTPTPTYILLPLHPQHSANPRSAMPKVPPALMGSRNQRRLV